MRALLGLFALLFAGVAEAATTSIMLPDSIVTVGDTITTRLYLSASDIEYNAYEAVVTFDTSKLAYACATEGTFFVGTCNNTALTVLQPTPGTLQIYHSILCYGDVRTAPGILIKLCFVALDEGTTDVRPTAVLLYRGGTLSATATVEEATISVIGCRQAVNHDLFVGRGWVSNESPRQIYYLPSNELACQAGANANGCDPRFLCPSGCLNTTTDFPGTPDTIQVNVYLSGDTLTVAANAPWTVTVYSNDHDPWYYCDCRNHYACIFKTADATTIAAYENWLEGDVTPDTLEVGRITAGIPCIEADCGVSNYHGLECGNMPACEVELPNCTAGGFPGGLCVWSLCREQFVAILSNPTYGWASRDDAVEVLGTPSRPAAFESNWNAWKTYADGCETQSAFNIDWDPDIGVYYVGFGIKDMGHNVLDIIPDFCNSGLIEGWEKDVAHDYPVAGVDWYRFTAPVDWSTADHRYTNLMTPLLKWIVTTDDSCGTNGGWCLVDSIAGMNLAVVKGYTAFELGTGHKTVSNVQNGDIVFESSCADSAAAPCPPRQIFIMSQEPEKRVGK